MIESGILKEDGRVQLIRGEIIEMSPIRTKHAACVNRLVNLLVQLLGKHVMVAAQNPVVLDKNSEPQPDVALLIFRIKGATVSLKAVIFRIKGATVSLKGSTVAILTLQPHQKLKTL